MDDILEPSAWFIEIANGRCPICGELAAFADDDLGHVFVKHHPMGYLLCLCRNCHRVFVISWARRDAWRVAESEWNTI